MTKDKHKKLRAAVLGFGGWGIALSLQLLKTGYNVTAWQRSREKAAKIMEERESPEYLPGVKLPEELFITSNMEDTRDADIVVFAAGAKGTREAAERFKPYVKKDQILVSASKGIEPDSRLRLSQVLAQVIPGSKIAAFSGPCHAEELSRGIISTCVASAMDQKAAEALQDAFMSPEFRVYTNPDIIGVELGGALKNVIALATGISDGLGNGDNIRAAIMTRGIVEIARLGVALGAKGETFSGLSGIGDLIATCTSEHSRNRRAGFLLGQGIGLEQTLDRVHMLVEGVSTAKAALELAWQAGIPMPITSEVNKVLFESKSPALAVRDLMERDKKAESYSG